MQLPSSYTSHFNYSSIFSISLLSLLPQITKTQNICGSSVFIKFLLTQGPSANLCMAFLLLNIAKNINKEGKIEKRMTEDRMKKSDEK